MRVLAGEDGGDELRVRMVSSMEVADNGIDVKRCTAVGDGHADAIVFEEEPACRAARTRHPGAAGIEDADAVNETIGDEMRVTADDHVGAASGKQRPEFLVGDAGFDAGAVVGSG